ncbi:hypothetical protein MNL09_07285 [Bartonella krasnovii]|nr:hypothetical protein MNL09_07285 [Bartonella krasnovii]
MAIIAKAVIMVNKQAGTLKRKRQRILIGMDMIVVMMNPTINHCRDNPMILIFFSSNDLALILFLKTQAIIEKHDKQETLYLDKK